MRDTASSKLNKFYFKPELLTVDQIFEEPPSVRPCLSKVSLSVPCRLTLLVAKPNPHLRLDDPAARWLSTSVLVEGGAVLSATKSHGS